jgi:hypothetical protein
VEDEASLEIQPLSIFNLRVAAEFVHFFGSFGFLQSFNNPLETYNDTTLGQPRSPTINDGNGSAMVNERQNYSTNGTHLMIEPFFQVKFGPLAIRNKLMIEYWKMNLREGDSVSAIALVIESDAQAAAAAAPDELPLDAEITTDISQEVSEDTDETPPEVDDES